MLLQNKQTCIDIPLRANCKISSVHMLPNGTIVMFLIMKQLQFLDVVTRQQDRKLIPIGPDLCSAFIAGDNEIGFLDNHNVCIMDLTTQVMRTPYLPELKDRNKKLFRMYYLPQFKTKNFILPVGSDIHFYGYNETDVLVQSNIYSDGGNCILDLHVSYDSGKVYTINYKTLNLCRVSPDLYAYDVKLDLTSKPLVSIFEVEDDLWMVVTPTGQHSLAAIIHNNEIVKRIQFNQFNNNSGIGQVECCYVYQGTLCMNISNGEHKYSTIVAKIIDRDIRIIGKFNQITPFIPFFNDFGMVSTDLQFLRYFYTSDAERNTTEQERLEIQEQEQESRNYCLMNLLPGETPQMLEAKVEQQTIAINLISNAMHLKNYSDLEKYKQSLQFRYVQKYPQDQIRNHSYHINEHEYQLHKSAKLQVHRIFDPWMSVYHLMCRMRVEECLIDQVILKLRE